MTEFLALLLTLFFAALPFALARRPTRREVEIMRLMERQGVGRMEAGVRGSLSPRLVLDHKGTRIRVSCTRALQSSPPWIWAHADLPRGPLGHIETYIENTLGSLHKLVGGQDIVIGSQAFDQAFVVKGHNDGAVKSWLSPALRDSLMHVKEQRPYLCYKDRALRFAIEGPLTKTTQLEDLLSVARAAVEALHSDTSHVSAQQEQTK